jgi:hypothetical protein
MSNAEIRSTFTDESGIFIDENTPLVTHTADPVTGPVYMRVQGTYRA